MTAPQELILDSLKGPNCPSENRRRNPTFSPLTVGLFTLEREIQLDGPRPFYHFVRENVGGGDPDETRSGFR